MWRWWTLAGGSLLLLAGVGLSPLGAHGGSLPYHLRADMSRTDPQCSTPSAAPSFEGPSVRNDESPPLRSITPAPISLPASVYLVPVAPAEVCSAPIGAAPLVRTVEPNTGPVGTVVTIRGAGFTPTENAVYFGQGYVPHLASSDGATLVFVVPASLEPPCRFASPPCRLPSIATPPGTYEVAVLNSGGLSNHESFTVPPAAGRP
jgi:hypothetical protein